MVAAVARDEGHFDSVNGPNRQRCRRVTVRGFDDDFPGVVEEFIEAGTPDYSDHESSLLELFDFESVT